MEGTHQHHFLIVTYPAQGHINPAIHLADRLVRTTGARITFSTSIFGHRKMFPNLTSIDQEVDDGGPITYIPLANGYDEGFNPGVDDANQYFSQFKTVGSQSLSSIIDTLDSRGRRVDCIIYNFVLSWAADVAHKHGIPSALYWIQAANVFAIYYHFFHGHEELVAADCKDPLYTVELPGLPPLCKRDLPSLLIVPNSSGDFYSVLLGSIKEAFLVLDREIERSKHKPRVLVNTFDELEADALSATKEVDLMAIGPILQSTPKDNRKVSGFDMFMSDEKEYIQWLDLKPKGSVVYVSFGSLAVLKKQQVEELSNGLKASRRPYLWVLRADCRYEGIDVEDRGESEMVVEWCSQMRVLSHPSIGCFVTHCGWNSTLESLVCGVPTVGVPQWTDQGMNAMLMERAWGNGVRGGVNEDGILNGEELRRCLDLVMGESERAMEIRKKAELWKERLAEAVGEGGSSDRSLRKFVHKIY